MTKKTSRENSGDVEGAKEYNSERGRGTAATHLSKLPCVIDKYFRDRNDDEEIAESKGEKKISRQKKYN
jgi:hypothetical protein